MRVMKNGDLQELIDQPRSDCISIYVPTVEKSQEVRQNRIRFKNLLDRVEDELLEAGMEKLELQRLLQPAQDLLRDSMFWQEQDEGLAVFVSHNFFRTYKLPIAVEEQVMINDRFYLKPMLAMLYGEPEFYILALALKNVRMFKATQHSVEEVHPRDLPKDMDKALGYDNLSKDIEFRTSSPQPPGIGVRGSQSVFFSGGGDAEDNRKDYILNFLRMVNKSVASYLKDLHAPLILACVEYIEPLYREANTYKHLMEKYIPGSPDAVSALELRDEAWPLVKPVFEREKSETIGRYKQLAGWKDKRATKDVDEVIKAAPFGRVEVLIVDKNAKKWGVFDAENVEVKAEDEQRPGNQDLLDFAAVQTLINGGQVYVVEPEDVPEGGSPVAAILRY